MGKDSLIKSTAKKQAAAKKKDEAKKTATAKKAGPPKKPKAKAKRTAPQKATKAVKRAAAKQKGPQKKAKGATPKAKAVAKPKPAKAIAKKKAAPKPKPAKKAAPPKQKPSIKALLMKKFDSARPPKASKPAPDARAAQKYDAPPFFTGLSDDDTRRLKALLLKKFDLQTLPAEPVTPAAEAKPAAKPAAPKPTAATPAPAAPPEPEPADEIPPPLAEEPMDPAEKILKYMAAVFVFLVLLVIGASFVNQGRYYLNSSNGAVEIWQGDFAPKGQSLLVALPGAEFPEVEATVYSKQDVYPIAFNYYIDKADAILDVPGAPNFDEVKVYLETALTYAANQDLRDIAYARLNNIDLLILMYKADVAGSRGTIASLESALAYLAEAKQLANALQAQQIDQKIEAFSASLASMEAAQAEADQLKADQQKLEQTQSAHE